MAVSICVTLHERDFCITNECDGDVAHCKNALCEKMPPEDGSKCCFDRDLQCQNIDMQIKAIGAMIRRLQNKKKELEMDKFLN